MKTQFMRGTTAQNNALVLPEGMLSIDVEKKALRVHDGVTPGGYEAVGTRAYEIINGPGPQLLAAGTVTEGYYGVVSSEELISGSALALEVGLSAGTAFTHPTEWLKFSLDGKTLFVAKKPIRYGVTWAKLASAKLVYGETQIHIGAHQFKVRLIKGSNTDPAENVATSGGSANVRSDPPESHQSEWNRLIYPVVDGRWEEFTEEELMTTGQTIGTATWCQEKVKEDLSYNLYRGFWDMRSYHRNFSTSNMNNYGWRPVLELIME